MFVKDVRMMCVTRASAARRSALSGIAWRRGPSMMWCTVARGLQQIVPHGRGRFDEQDWEDGREPPHAKDNSEAENSPRVRSRTYQVFFSKVDFMLYALLQAYPRAIPYRRMMRALVDAGCIHHHRDARSFIWYSCKRYRAISIQNTKSMVFERFKRLTKGQCKALTIFPIEMNDVGYMKYLERTRHIAVPDLARREVEKILQVPNLPPANIILPPVREAIGEELFAAKYKYVSPQQVPEKFLAAMKFKHLTSNDQGLQDGPAQHQAEAQDNIHLTAQTTASEHVQ